MIGALVVGAWLAAADAGAASSAAPSPAPSAPAPSSSADVLVAADRAHRADDDKGALVRLEALRTTNDYDVLWRLARARFAVAARVADPRRQALAAKGAVDDARAAAQRAPDRVEGHAWLCASLGLYGGAAGPIDALRAGVPSELPKACERAAAIDERYYDALPLRILARAAHQAPWPLRDVDKAVATARRAVAAGPYKARNWFFLADALWDDDERDEARRVARQCLLVDVDQEQVPADGRLMQRQCRALLAR